ncbi:MAG: matrixin family metalloprotease [Planctomycetes bacterium]|nr:matrixin family metalloprotease [Planctomycetota bacterium]
MKRRQNHLVVHASIAISLLACIAIAPYALSYTQIRGSDSKPAIWDLDENIRQLTNVEAGRVIYQIDTGGTADDLSGMPFDEFQAIQNSFQRWEQVGTSNVAFQYNGKVSGMNAAADETNILKWTNDLSAGVFAVTWTTFQEDTTITDADLLFNESFHWATSDAIGANPEPRGTVGRADIENIATHEIGHFIGFDHTFIGKGTMYASSDTGFISLRTLEADDVGLVSAVYPSSSFFTTFGKVQGIVTSNSDVIFGAHVNLIDATTLEPVIGTHTDKQGVYTIEGVPPGNYYVYCGQMRSSELGNSYYGTIQQTFITELYPDITVPAATPQIVSIAAGQTVTNVNFDVALTGSPGESDDTSSSAQELPIGRFISSRIETKTDVDWYRIAAPSADRNVVITVEARGIGSSLDAKIDWYDAGNLTTPRASNDDRDDVGFDLSGENRDPRIGTFTSPEVVGAGEETFVRVRAYNSSTKGYYLIAVLDTAGLEAPSQTLSTTLATPGSVLASGADTIALTVTLKNLLGETVSNSPTVTMTTSAGTITSGSAQGTSNVTLAETSVGTGVYTASLSPAGAGQSQVTISVTAGGVALTPKVVYFTGPLDPSSQSMLSTSASAIAGDGNSVATITLTPKDANGFPVFDASLNGAVVFSTDRGTLLGVPAFDANTGKVTQQLLSESTAVDVVATITATANSTSLAGSVQVTFSADPSLLADSDNSTITASPASIFADGSSTLTVTVQAKNSAGTFLTSSPVVTIVFVDENGAEVTPNAGVSDNEPNIGGNQAAPTSTVGVYAATITSVPTPQQQRVSARIGSLLVSAPALITFSGAVDLTKTKLEASQAVANANGTDSVTITLSPRDGNDFPVIDPNLVVAFSAPGANLSGAVVYDASSGAYLQTIRAPTTASAITVSATIGGNEVAETAQVQFVGGVATGFSSGSSSGGGCGGCDTSHKNESPAGVVLLVIFVLLAFSFIRRN